MHVKILRAFGGTTRQAYHVGTIVDASSWVELNRRSLLEQGYILEVPLAPEAPEPPMPSLSKKESRHGA